MQRCRGVPDRPRRRPAKAAGETASAPANIACSGQPQESRAACAYLTRLQLMLNVIRLERLMDSRSQLAFLALILAQAAHSVEEYAFRLYDVFAPARLVSSLVSDDLAVGFVIANAALVLFGLWCYIARIRVGHRSAEGWVWLWLLIEFGNGIGHPVVALMRGAYFPGVVTAPVLLALSAYLAARMWRIERHPRAAV